MVAIIFFNAVKRIDLYYVKSGLNAMLKSQILYNLVIPNLKEYIVHRMQSWAVL